MILKDKVIWITGASSGIGEALAYELAKKGNKLVLSARRENELERVKKNCENQGNVFVLPLDMAERTEMVNAASKVNAHFGAIDMVIFNAGISNRSYIKDTSLSVFERIMEVNYFGNVALLQAVLPYLTAQKESHVIAISSLSGKFASPGRGAYSSSKHAIQALFDTLRMEHHKDNLKVTIVCPGFVKTNVTINSLKGDGRQQGKLDKTTAGGITAELAAQKIINAAEANKQEVAFGGTEKFGLYIKRFFPSMLTKIVLSSEKNWKLNNTVDK